ncbi:MAG TPA: hypothetical protein VHY22_17260 [Chthoniobacteraceae bacterium]|jgi:hypothetical protein|nr:hypothetical protein [Chthoniobacteraceae bacterium]
MIHPQLRRFRHLFDTFLEALPRSVRIGLLGPETPHPRLIPRNRLHGENHTSDLCKQYLRHRYPDKLAEVEDFIANIESTGSDRGVSRWERLIDATNVSDELLWPLDVKFQGWLNHRARNC